MCATLLFENGAVGTFQASINERDSCSVRQISGDRGLMVIENCRSLAFDHKDVIRLGRYDEPLTRAVASERSMLHQPEIRWCRPPLVGDQPVWMKQLQKVGLWKPRPHGLEVLMNSFIRAIRGDGEPIVTGRSALHTVELMNAILLSALRRREVDLPLESEAYDGLFEELNSKGSAVLAGGGTGTP